MAVQARRPIRLAQRLREAREARGLSFRQIADATKLSTRVVSAIEEGRDAELPQGIYRRAIVRALATEIGLDPEETLRAFLDERPDDLPAPGTVAVVHETVQRRRSSWHRVAALFGAVVPLLVGVAYFGRVALPRPVAEDFEAIAEARGADAEAVAAGGFARATAFGARPVVMIVTVTAPTDLRILADGVLVIGRSFEAGESLEVPFSDAVELSGDNAGAVQFSINGQAGRMLGTAGEPLAARITRDDYPAFLSGR